MAQAVSIPIYQLLEDRLGREEAAKVASAIEVSLATIEKRADDAALQKKLEIEDDLTKKLVTKAEFLGENKALRQEIQTVRQEIQTVRQEIQTVRQEIQTVKVDLEGRIMRLDQKFNFMIVLTIIALTLMNPVAAELIKGWLAR